MFSYMITSILGKTKAPVTTIFGCHRRALCLEFFYLFTISALSHEQPGT